MLARNLAAVLLLVIVARPAPAAAPQQQQTQMPDAPASIWRPSQDHLTFVAANLDVPRVAGSVHFTRSFEFSHPGEGIDSGLQFESTDGHVFATIYVYYPGLSHAALSAFATDWVIHSQSPNLHEIGIRAVSAGGRDQVAIRGDYSGFRDGLASSASFIKIGRWIVKLRVSGPGARMAEVGATMTALLDGLRFNGPLRPRPAAPFDLANCMNPPASPAHALPETQALVLEDGITAIMDGAGEEAVDPQGNHIDPLPSRIGQHWCQPVTLRIGNSSASLLRATGSAGSGFGGRTVMLAPVNDAGTTFEQVETTNHHFVLLYHNMGTTAVLGSYDGPLADAQIADIMSGADNDGGRFRATARHIVGGSTNFEINVATDPSPAHRD